MKAPLIHTSILINPSDKLAQYVRNLNHSDQMPLGVSGLCLKKPVKTQRKQVDPVYHISADDQAFISNLNLDAIEVSEPSTKTCTSKSSNSKYFLNLEDLYWIYNHIQKDNEAKENLEKIYFHELFEGSKIVLPENEEIPRNEELEQRCQKLRAQQQNMEYKKITKDVDSVRRQLPEDTISYQLKQLNKQLIAIGQFIISVAAGFAFGFIGVELMIGNLDFGFRLLLGIICALIIALAELYFLAKKLNEDLQYDMLIKDKVTHSKID